MRKIFVNFEKCTGCRICEVACALVRWKACAPTKSMLDVYTSALEFSDEGKETSVEELSVRQSFHQGE